MIVYFRFVTVEENIDFILSLQVRQDFRLHGFILVLLKMDFFSQFSKSDLIFSSHKVFGAMKFPNKTAKKISHWMWAANPENFVENKIFVD